MAGLWGTVGNWRAHWRGYCPYPNVVHLYIFPYARFATHHLYDTGFLDEHEAVYFGEKKESVAVAVMLKRFILPQLDYQISCSLSEEQIHQVLNVEFDRVSSTGLKFLLGIDRNVSEYFAGKGEFRIDKEDYSRRNIIMESVVIGTIITTQKLTTVDVQSNGFSFSAIVAVTVLLFFASVLGIAAIIAIFSAPLDFSGWFILMIAALPSLRILLIKAELRRYLVRIQSRMVRAISLAEN